MCCRRLRALGMWSCAVFFVFGLLVFTGCAASYAPPQVTKRHPAHPEAAAAPSAASSKTLAYGASDIPALQPAVLAAQQHSIQPGMQHGGHGNQAAAQASGQTFVGEGKVIAVVPGSQLVVDHKEIKGFMGPMTMGYRVEPPSLLEGVQAGDAVRFTIDAQQNAIIRLEKMKD